MPLRILVYLVRIWEAYHKLHGGPLPLIVPAVVSHAPDGWSAPTSFHEMFEPLPDTIPHISRLVPRFSYLLSDLARSSHEELRRWQLPPFAMTVIHYLRDGRHFDQLLQSVPEWIGLLGRLARGADRNPAALEQLLRYLVLVTGELLRAEGRVAGRVEGRAEGRMQGHAEMLAKQMHLKFGTLSAEDATRIEQATEQQLDRYIERILTAKTIDDVFAD